MIFCRKSVIKILNPIFFKLFQKYTRGAYNEIYHRKKMFLYCSFFFTIFIFYFFNRMRACDWLPLHSLLPFFNLSVSSFFALHFFHLNTFLFICCCCFFCILFWIFSRVYRHQCQIACRHLIDVTCSSKMKTRREMNNLIAIKTKWKPISSTWIRYQFNEFALIKRYTNTKHKAIQT